MKLTTGEDHWSQVSTHCFARNSNGAPWRVQLHVAALVGNHRIVGSVARFTASRRPTVWDIRAVTDDGRLVVVVVEFDADGYDLDEETSTYQQHHPVQPVVREAWVRSLRHVVRLDIRTASQRSNSFGERSHDEFDIGDVHLVFADGADVGLGFDQAATYDHHQRAGTDAFFDAVRQATGL